MTAGNLIAILQKVGPEDEVYFINDENDRVLDVSSVDVNYPIDEHGSMFVNVHLSVDND